jgi:hypothetical protein
MGHWPESLNRTEAALFVDQETFDQAARKEDVTDRAIADARFAPGDLPKAFRAAKPKSSPTTDTEREWVRRLESPLELGLWSNAIFYAPPLRYAGRREHAALFSLIKGGVVRVIEAGPPDSYWLALAEPEHARNGTTWTVVYSLPGDLRERTLEVVADDADDAFDKGRDELRRRKLFGAAIRGMPRVPLPSDSDDYEPNASYYVWVMGTGDEPLAEKPVGPHSLESAKTTARIAATEGVHDRAVSIGRDPKSGSFEVVRRYRAGSGERVL